MITDATIMLDDIIRERVSEAKSLEEVKEILKDIQTLTQNAFGKKTKDATHP